MLLTKREEGYILYIDWCSKSVIGNSVKVGSTPGAVMDLQKASVLTPEKPLPWIAGWEGAPGSLYPEPEDLPV